MNRYFECENVPAEEEKNCTGSYYAGYRIIIKKKISDTVSGIDTRKTGIRIKAFCNQKKVSVKDIQEALYIGSFQSIYAWFSGKTLPNLDNMYRLSKLLGVTINDLIVDEQEDESFFLETYTTDMKEKQQKLEEYRNKLYCAAA